jgi:limonene-1,2-epoxide hydrolase
MTMATAGKIVSDYQQALGKGDFAGARKLVHDNLLFQGPLDTFHSPEPYFEALKKLHPIIQRIDMKKIFADGNDVCVLYDMVTNTPIGTAFVCEWYQVKGGKIADVRTLFDARPFAAMFAQSAPRKA